MSADPPHASAGREPDWPVVEFLLRLRADEANGTARNLLDYLAEHRGDPAHQEAVAREFLLVRSFDRDARATTAAHHTIGRFRLVRELGRGGQGTVHLAMESTAARPVALKVLHRRGDELDAARLVREVDLASRLTHPSLARVLGTGCDDGRAWIATEYVAGETLAAHLHQLRLTGTAMTVVDAASLAARLAEGLHHAHGNGVIHRDVKPGNVLLRVDGTPVLTDFGLARGDATDAALTHSGELRGTPAYMAPEQLATGTATARSDVWGLGAILFECLTGERPFAAPTVAGTATAVARREVWSLPGYARMPRDVRAVLAVALAKAPSQRYATAADFARDCVRLVHGERPAARQPGLVRRGFAFVRNEPALAIASVTAALLLAGGLTSALWFLARERDLHALLQAREQRVRSVARSMLFELHTAARNLPGAVALRRGILERARDALQELHDAAPEDLDVRGELVSAWIALGDVLGHGGVANAGDPAEARRCYETAAGLAEPAIAAGDAGARTQFATTLLRRADLAIDAPELARPLYVRANELLTETDDLQRALRASVSCSLAQLDRNAGAFDLALRECREAERLFAATAGDPTRASDLASTRIVLATILVARGDLGAARTVLQTEAARLDALRQANPNHVQLLARAAQCAIYQGQLEWTASNPDAALAAVERGVALRRARVATDAQDRGALHELALGLFARAQYRQAIDRCDLALVEADYREAGDCAAAAGFADFAADLHARAAAIAR